MINISQAKHRLDRTTILTPHHPYSPAYITVASPVHLCSQFGFGSLDSPQLSQTQSSVPDITLRYALHDSNMPPHSRLRIWAAPILISSDDWPHRISNVSPSNECVEPPWIPIHIPMHPEQQLDDYDQLQSTQIRVPTLTEWVPLYTTRKKAEHRHHDPHSINLSMQIHMIKSNTKLFNRHLCTRFISQHAGAP